MNVVTVSGESVKRDVSCGKHVLAPPFAPQAGLSEDVLLGSSQIAVLKVL